MNYSHRKDALLVAETLRFIEAEAPLDDTEANRQAAAGSGDREQQLLQRAALLGRRLGLQQALDAWRAHAPIAWAVLALLVFLAGYSLLQGLLGAGRTINVVMAFVAALGVHFATLAFWLLSLWLGRSGSSLLARFSLGNTALQLASMGAGGQAGRRRYMLSAAFALLERGRLLPWLLGLTSHAIWSLVFLLALAGLWFMFSFREYRLTWETTIQSSQFFTAFIESTGRLPRALGFPVPGENDLAGGGGNAQQTLAWWLIGCTFAYGLLPRLLLTLLSALIVMRGVRRLKLDTSDPYYRKLLARMDEFGRSKVVDPERRVDGDLALPGVRSPGDKDLHAVVGFELPPEYEWPPSGIGQGAALSLNVSGAGDQVREALDRLAALRPGRVLFVCDQAQSPDRGTARFLREAVNYADRASLLLMGDRGAEASNAQRWYAWLADSGLQNMTAHDNPDAAAAWLAGHRD